MGNSANVSSSWVGWSAQSGPEPSEGHKANSRFTISVYLPTYTLIMSKGFTIHPRRALIQRKPESLPASEPLVGFLLKSMKTRLCCASGLEQRGCWESPIVLATACQTHSSGERSYGQWPSGLVWPKQIHSCSLFRLSKQNQQGWFVYINGTRLTNSWISMSFGHSKAEAPK